MTNPISICIPFFKVCGLFLFALVCVILFIFGSLLSWFTKTRMADNVLSSNKELGFGNRLEYDLWKGRLIIEAVPHQRKDTKRQVSNEGAGADETTNSSSEQPQLEESLTQSPETAETADVVAQSPLEQFDILSLLPMNIGNLYFSFTNPSLFMLLTLSLGLIFILYTMFVWWRDVLRESTLEGHHTKVVQLGLRYGFILFIVSEVMFFFAFFGNGAIKEGREGSR